MKALLFILALMMASTPVKADQEQEAIDDWAHGTPHVVFLPQLSKD